MSYPKIVEQIHNEFNNAGEKLLQQALEIINGKEHLALKANRLDRVGFKKANDVERWRKISINKEVADLVSYYQQKYPASKFITEEQVAAINKKYNLVCAPIDRYKGFVPDVKLKVIEEFSVAGTDKREPVAKLHYSMPVTDEKGIKNLREKYPNDIVPLSLCASSIRGFGGGSGYISVDRYDRIDKVGFFICAPKKDMYLKGLEKFGAVFASFTTVTFPDPVVLHPVKGGYLIVAAWGDEASDPIVVNQKMN